MHAMQYEITLPADYDMDIIRSRVDRARTMLDEFDGLGMKTYVIREHGVDGSPVNQYAPFYLWHDEHRMNTFLWDGMFDRIIASFGRPPVQHWTGLAFHEGPAYGAAPQAASKHTEHVSAETGSPTEFVVRAAEALEEHARRDGVHSSALVIDTRHWQLMRYTLWEGTPPKEDEVRYQILHASMPGLGLLRRGRHW